MTPSVVVYTYTVHVHYNIYKYYITDDNGLFSLVQTFTSAVAHIDITFRAKASDELDFQKSYIEFDCLGSSSARNLHLNEPSWYYL